MPFWNKKATEEENAARAQSENSHLEDTKQEDAFVTDEVQYTPAEERRLLLKLDMILMPFSVCIYLLAYLDRGNLGNARLIGLEQDVLDGNANKYSIALTCFFITYIVFCVPGTLSAKVMSPAHTLAFGCFVWSLAATCMAGTHNPAGVYVCRLFIGVGEAFFGQSLPLWCSFFYTKREFAKRVAFFICFATLAGAFGGLIAFGVAHIHSHIQQWRILFLIEGLPGILLAVLTFLLLPSRPGVHSPFFTEREQAIAVARKHKESTHEHTNSFDWQAVKYALLDWRVWGTGFVCFCINVNISSVMGFLPSIIKLMGYTAAKAQLLTVPPYAVALVLCVGTSVISDRKQMRGPFLVCTFLIGIVGWSLLLALDPLKHGSPLHGRYFGCIAIVASGFTGIPLSTAWVAGNNPNESQRAVGLGMITTVGQFGSIVGSFIFKGGEAPHFPTATGVNIAFQALGVVLTVVLSLWWTHQNKAKDKAEGGRPTDFSNVNVQEHYDKAVGFRYVP